MRELSEYVDCLFARYENDGYISDLKAEIISNLEAKLQDLLEQGMDKEVALQKVKESITNIDELVGNKRKVYINRFKLESLQISLLYLIIGWILTMPLNLIKGFSVLGLILFICIICTGVIYILKSRNEKDLEATCLVQIESYRKSKNVAWILWSMFYAMYTFIITAACFGSNIWFSRPVKIDGPYNFAMLILRYYEPLITILLPLAVSHVYRILLKSEVREI